MEWTRDSVTLARFPRHPTNGWTVRLRPSTSSDAVSVSLALPFLRIPGVLMRADRGVADIDMPKDFLNVV
jgi:hypothetical protein